LYLYCVQVKLWRVPEGGLTENLTEWFAELIGHSKKISYIEWHPSASNVLLSAGADLQVRKSNVLLSAGADLQVRKSTVLSAGADFQVRKSNVFLSAGADLQVRKSNVLLSVGVDLQVRKRKNVK